VSSLVFLYLYLGRQPVAEVKGFRGELAEGLGTVGLWALAVIYGRSALKVVLAEGTLLQRFIPEEYHGPSVSVTRRVLQFLNGTHKYVGALAVLVFAGHAVLGGTTRWNLFLMMVLALVAWQGIFGLFLVIRFSITTLKRYGYLVHAQLFTGVMIAIFAAFGHLLLED